MEIVNECVTSFFLEFRHSIKMIMKLRSAGLGFFVKERDTQQRLGS